MCFSASASFGAAAVIGAAGLLALKKVSNPLQVLFACIPLLFAVQQVSEGFVWLSYNNKEYAYLEKPATIFFLFFAQVAWPLVVPLSIYLVEKNDRRKKILAFFTVMGSLSATANAILLLTSNAEANISNHHIDYYLLHPSNLSWIISAVYIMVTIIPPFISGIKKMMLFGILVLASLIFTLLLFPAYIISVWCYFAALISVVILYLVADMNKQDVAYKKSLLQ